MAIHARTVALAGLVLLVACGGGGGALRAGANAPGAPEVAAGGRPAPAPAARGGARGGGDGGGAQQLADLGTCRLESGGAITSCRIGYRTFGKLNAARSNAVLVPTWFTGTTESLLDVVPDKLVDTSRFHLVLVDALADGVSSAPSNSKEQPRLAFPRITIRDMVEAERRLVVDVLGIPRLHAVMGISMGGMQAMEWGVSHPSHVERVVSIVGTPRLTAADLHLWTTELNALASDVAYLGGNYQGRPELRALVALHELMLTTPSYRARETSREAFPAWMAKVEANTSFDWNDWRRQLEAMMAHDVGAPHGGLDRAFERVTARSLVVVADQDHMVHPGPSLGFAEAVGARVVHLEGDCGHLAPTCESEKVQDAVRAFLVE
jgi:homoserine O-acetyltransferase/O-succinyltransferase